LCREAVEICENIKHKNQIKTVVDDLNGMFSVILNLSDGQGNLDEERLGTIRTQLLKLLERAYQFVKGKYLFRVIKLDKKNFLRRLENFMEMVNKSSTLLIFIDLSGLDILHENEVKVLIDLKGELEAKGIQIGLIADGPFARRMMNIFDSIIPIANFHLFRSELDALVGMFRSQVFFNRINQQVVKLQAG